VSLVREMLNGLADAVALDRTRLDDIKTAVSEACNNVVLHAYNGGEGPMELTVYIDEASLEVVVRDQGSGIRPRPAGDERMQGIGLSVIQALTDRAVFTGATGEGTEVCMEFNSEIELKLYQLNPGEATDPRTIADGFGETLISVAPAALLANVLARVVTALAARAHFSLDRLSDVQMVTDAIAAHAPGSLDGTHLTLGVDAGDHRLDMRVGVLRAGSAQRIVHDSAVGGLEPLLEKLSDAVTVEPSPGGERLWLQLVDRR
jgi:anti-sigma regulatory factor (Ser/Thr protein kinase)